MREHIDELLVLCVSLIFGFSYSVQSIGAKYVEAFSFCALKNIIAFIALLIICLIRRKKSGNFKKAIIYGAIIAIVLTIFSYLQQVVAIQNTPGKTGFITSMYILEVPIINFIFFKKKINPQILFSLVFAVAGLVLLCDLSNFTININDVLTIISSLCSSFFISIFSIIGAFITNETYNPSGYIDALWPLFYVGVVCAALGVSMQAYAQKTLDETTSSIILSLESLFSVFAGYLMLDTSLTKKEMIGCLLMFVAVVMCVTADRKKKI